METRRNKRPWQSTPSKKARVELDFGQNTPSPKRIRLSASVADEQADDLDGDSFTIKSFYGKREKLHFPHSPGTKRAVNKVREKMLSSTDENTDSENEPAVRRSSRNVKERKEGNQTEEFEFRSSESSDTGRRAVVLKQKDANVRSKKVPLDIVKVKKTPRNRARKVDIEKAASTGTVRTRSKELREQQTPVTTGKKFFKTRSPASADRQFGKIIIEKGFNVKFCPRRLNMSSSKSEKSKTRSKKKEHKTMPVKTIKASVAPFDDKMFFFSDNEKTDGTEEEDPLVNNVNTDVKGTGTKSPCDVEQEQSDKVDVSGDHSAATGVKEVALAGAVNFADGFTDVHKTNTSAHERSDSGIETSNSNVLSSSIPEEKCDAGCGSDMGKASQNSDTELSQLSDEMSEMISLIGAGSESLFSSSGRNTPVASMGSKETTPLKQVSLSSSNISPTESATGTSETSSVVSGEETPKPVKLFPIFMKKSASKNSSPLDKVRGRSTHVRSAESSPRTPRARNLRNKNDMDQMIIDAGQARFGATRCHGCGMIYTYPDEEVLHHKFHSNLQSALKFTGWKKEHVVQEYLATGSRVIMVTDDSPNYATKKVEDINRVMGEELGFPEPGLTFRPGYKAFLYISEEKRIEGCCVAEPITEGYRVLPESQSEGSPQKHPGHRPWCCSDVPEKAFIGISRIWVQNQARRKGIATRLLDCVRQWALYGIEIPRSKMAFSDPTPDGKLLATRYAGTPHFLVYKYIHH